MDPIEKIVPLDWMMAPATVAVIEALTADGADARFVGGCVRDALLKLPVKDIDIATPEPPERVMALLHEAGIKAIPTGLKHGTVTVAIGQWPIEVTTLRIDLETDGRHAKVAFTDDWMADAARRDFTINTMSCTPGGDIYDFFGALDDLSNGHVRFVGNARERIEEDLLRGLRFFRFHATYGRLPADISALAACRELAPRFAELSSERRRDEIFRILLAPNPADTLQLMQGEKICDFILPEAGDVGRLRLLTWLETSAIKVDSVGADSLRRLAALLDTDAGGAEAVARRLKFSNTQTKRLIATVASRRRISPDGDERALRRALQCLGPQKVRDLVLLAWAGELAVTPRLPQPRTHAWLGLLAAADAWTPLQFPLRGSDVTALGVEAGPRVGSLLGAVETWWRNGDYRAGKDQCLEKLKTVLKDSG
ncbi:MAG TPA: CCA tRNA nucleotidyltransferase [Rhodospirillales bacterium]|nr:CCA tRNA nucleotidyltransferase [Rhodospirillales bacterium]